MYRPEMFKQKTANCPNSIVFLCSTWVNGWWICRDDCLRYCTKSMIIRIRLCRKLFINLMMQWFWDARSVNVWSFYVQLSCYFHHSHPLITLVVSGVVLSLLLFEDVIIMFINTLSTFTRLKIKLQMFIWIIYLQIQLLICFPV